MSTMVDCNTTSEEETELAGAKTFASKKSKGTAIEEGVYLIKPIQETST
jgi:hypothetical protein